MLRALLYFFGINLLVFLVYRLLFVHQFSTLDSQSIWVCVYGLRLDMALLCIEVLLFLFFSFVIGRFRWRWYFCYCWTLLFFHAMFVVANLQFFKERNQQVGDSLVAYLTSPYEIYIAAYPVLHQQPWLCVLVGLILFGSYMAGIWWSSRWYGLAVKLWWNIRPIIVILVTAAILVIPCLDIVANKKISSATGENTAALGWKIQLVHSKHYMLLDNFILQQAIINPCYEFFRVNLPQGLQGHVSYELAEEKAWKMNQSVLALSTPSSDYPLAREIVSPLNLGVENVIILQVEGLSQTMIARQEQGRYVMPYLHQLSQQDIYFPNGIQNFGATIGSFFATATSMHKACFDEAIHPLTMAEEKANLGTLAYLLGDQEYCHYFGQSCLQNYHDFAKFMQKQNYQTYDYHDFCQRLQAKKLLAEADDGTSIFDGYFLQECAEIILQTPPNKKFTGHFLTVTSHSPWTIPKAHPRAFPNGPAEFNAFAYTDAAIAQFVQTLQQDPRWDKTIVILVADHTSILCDDIWERVRIPIIFSGPPIRRYLWNLQQRPKHFSQVYASHVDILPTTLYLMGGKRSYYGVGKNLIVPQSLSIGALGANRTHGYYAQNDFLLQYSHFDEEAQLFAISNGRMASKDCSEQNPLLTEQMLAEYLAQSELSRRLVEENRIVPGKK